MFNHSSKQNSQLGTASYPFSERDHQIARSLPELFGMQTCRGTTKHRGQIFCSSLRIDHIRGVHDVSTYCRYDAVGGFRSALARGERVRRRTLEALAVNDGRATGGC